MFSNHLQFFNFLLTADLYNSRSTKASAGVLALEA